MSIITKNIDAQPYTETKSVVGKVRVKTHDEAAWLDGYFNGATNYSQVEHVTRGNTYDVVKIIGHGDVEDVVIIDDIGEEQELCDFFFKEIN